MRITVSIAALAALIALAALPAGAGASVGADLRVVGPSGQLDDLTQYSDTTTMPTSPQAECFGAGSGGSGQGVAVDGANALGIVVEAAKSQKQLNPLQLTDTFVSQGFGLGVCGIGGQVASGSAFWYTKVDHVGLQVGGSQFPIHGGQQVLWYLAPNFPPPAELVLNAPAREPIGAPFPVQVLAYADDGTATPAAGAVISGSGAPVTTDASGNALVSVSGTGPRQIQATLGDDIPSEATPICSFDAVTDCAAERGRLIVGSDGADEISGTAWRRPDQAARRHRRGSRPGRQRPDRRPGRRQGPRQLRRRHRFGQGRQARQARQELRAAQPRRQEAQAPQAQAEGQGVSGARILAAALALGATVAAGCGLGPGKDQGDVSLTVTRDYGSRVLVQKSDSIHESDTVLRVLDRNTDITTRYGGGFVQSIDGLSGTASGGHSFDWFFYVNGIESPVGSTDYDLSGGDRIWWDYRDWTAAMRVPAVVGSWPEPFVHGFQGHRWTPTSIALVRAQRATRSLQRSGQPEQRSPREKAGSP